MKQKQKREEKKITHQVIHALILEMKHYRLVNNLFEHPTVSTLLRSRPSTVSPMSPPHQIPYQTSPLPPSNSEHDDSISRTPSLNYESAWVQLWLYLQHLHDSTCCRVSSTTHITNDSIYPQIDTKYNR